MKKPSIRLLPLLLAATVLPALAAPSEAPYAVAARHALGGPGGWDYLSLDAAAHRLYIARDDRVMVMDTASGKLAGEVAGMQHAHGVALSPSTHEAFVSSGRGDEVTVFDTQTLKVTRHIAVSGKNPDAILFDSASGHLLTMNGRSNNLSVIDAQAGKELSTVALPGRPEFAVADGNGLLYLNLEDKNALARVDLKAGKVTAVWAMAPCDGPTGLALDAAHGRLFSVCDNGWLIVTDAHDGHQVAKVEMGKGPDAVIYDAARHTVLGSAGEDGVLSVVAQDDADHYRLLGNLPTQKSARTMVLDPSTHEVYLAAATASGKGKPVEGFQVLVAAPH
ncbi:DNA-binding beta-propeller fold protein YncE [Dyella sp. SG562]|uniref:YncE family protein n=1 Tax=Dyella sp. SG562 TaxID=2587017 RepID=UPI0014213CF0|nr:YncE family protein [Dyella sp. SG562]NII71520.1 DNA-binding beta-propeller fold protein YncE [Dyella sp. SG562]